MLLRQRLSPGHHRTAPRKHDDEHEQAANPVDRPSGLPGEQVVVQVDEPFHDLHGKRVGVAHVDAGELIELPRRFGAVARQSHVDRLVGPPLRFNDRKDLVVGVDALDRFPQAVAGKRDADGLGHGARYEPHAQFAPEHDGAAADACDDDVGADRDGEPQMDLQQRLAKPETLGSVDPALPHRPVRSRRIAAVPIGAGAFVHAALPEALTGGFRGATGSSSRGRSHRPFDSREV